MFVGVRSIRLDEVDLRFWGKERGLGVPYPLVCHGLDAGAAVRVLWRGYVSSNVKARLSEALGLSEDETGAVLEFWASLHDLGKIVPAFQRQVEIPDGFADDGNSVAHQRASAWCVPGLMESQGYSSAKTGWARLAAQILGGHHGRFEELKARSQLGDQHLPCHGLGAAQWQEERARVVTRLGDLLAPCVHRRRS